MSVFSNSRHVVTYELGKSLKKNTTKQRQNQQAEKTGKTTFNFTANINTINDKVKKNMF